MRVHVGFTMAEARALLYASGSVRDYEDIERAFFPKAPELRAYRRAHDKLEKQLRAVVRASE